MIRAKIIGAGGYGGIGLVELMLNHPEVEIACLTAKDDVGRPISEMYPHLKGFCDLEVLAPDDAAADVEADVVFFSTPDRVGMKLASAYHDRGVKIIDYSGDFRFNNAEDYAEYARRLDKEPSHLSPELLPLSAYGLPEINRQNIAGKEIVGNPGCFAVSCLLGLAPAVAQNLVDPSSLICDCKTGISGAGKKPNAQFHYPARYDHMNAYRLTGHQHVCEVEQNLARLGGEGEVKLTFTAQVVPATRGIMSCLYGQLAEGITPDAVMEVYKEFNKDNPFVRIFDRNAVVGTAHVRGSNYCNLVVDVDERCGRMRIVSYIDNLVKGQAGSALQNMNLLFDLPETVGLDRPGQYP